MGSGECVTAYRTLIRAEQTCGMCQRECFELVSRHFHDHREVFMQALVCPNCDAIGKANP